MKSGQNNSLISEEVTKILERIDARFGELLYLIREERRAWALLYRRVLEQDIKLKKHEGELKKLEDKILPSLAA